MGDMQLSRLRHLYMHINMSKYNPELSNNLNKKQPQIKEKNMIMILNFVEAQH